MATDGDTEHLNVDEFSVRSLRDWVSPKSETVYRLEWELEVPGIDGALRSFP